MSEQNFEQQMKKLRRDLAFTRVVCILTSVVTLLLICGGGYLFWRMQGILEKPVRLLGLTMSNSHDDEPSEPYTVQLRLDI